MKQNEIITFTRDELELLLAAAASRALEENGGAEFSQREMRKRYGCQFDHAVEAGLKPCARMQGKLIYRVSDFLAIRSHDMKTARIIREALA